MNNSKILLIGAGQMALEYTKVLKELGCNFIVIGRGKESSEAFQKETGTEAVIGGASQFLKNNDYGEFKAIVAVTGDQLGEVCLALIEHGIKSILVEKPGGLDEKEINLVKMSAEKNSAKVFIAYNRRFYSSVKKAREIIKEDGGVLSLHFEFNELSDMITSLNTSAEIKKRWLLHNSTHVIDLAFFLCGLPRSLSAHTSAFLSWHPKGAIFTGNGVTIDNIPFTYHANWIAPGRWGIEVMTKNHRLIFRPLEKLYAQKRGSLDLVNIDLEDELDIKFKPGLYKEVESFLMDSNSLCSVEEQSENLNWYNKILNGS